jgi:hypothetical protein
MDLSAYEMYGDLHKSTRFVNDDYIIEYYNKEDKRHREDGPAIIMELKQDNNEYFEWWNQDLFIALFNKNKHAFLKSVDGTHKNLYKIQLPEQWIGNEKKLSLIDIEKFK